MTRETIEALRRLLREKSLDAYIVPSTDPHQSEYVPECWQRRRFLTGFTGSAGDAVITRAAAGLWTDSRYWLQAQEQLDPDVFTLFKKGAPGVPDYEDWLRANLGSGARVGVDARLFSHSAYGTLGRKLEEAGAVIEAVEENLVDVVWKERPPRPKEPVHVQEEAYAGETVESKLERLRRRMAAAGAAAHVVTALDAIAWLFNLRGADIPYNPVTIAYAVVREHSAILFIDREKISASVAKHLENAAEIRPYQDFSKELLALRESKGGVWVDPATCSRWITERLAPGGGLHLEESPITRSKAVKNAVELAGMERAHVRDGVALVRFLIWLEKALPSGGVTERGIAEKLDHFRARGKLYQGPSFESIVGFGAHGAIVHYAATPETDAQVRAPGILLIDSGGQYLDGTTDVTRTLALGEPTPEQRDRFTRMLRGHIRLSLQPFPQGTDGVQLDTLARMYLWEEGLNFGHGVGHGVGSYLCVHEMPPAISHLRGRNVRPEPGMVVTNEPGYYKEGEYGFRQENIMVVKEWEGLSKEVPFLRLKPLTLCPIDLKLVERSLLNGDELQWLNGYHRRVREALSPSLSPQEAAWLDAATKAL